MEHVMFLAFFFLAVMVLPSRHFLPSFLFYGGYNYGW